MATIDFFLRSRRRRLLGLIAAFGLIRVDNARPSDADDCVGARGPARQSSPGE
jgi:hypothetical protein